MEENKVSEKNEMPVKEKAKKELNSYFDNLKNFIKDLLSSFKDKPIKNGTLFFIGVLLGVILVWILWHLKNQGTRNFWFTTGENHFQWVGISAFAAAIGLVVNAWQNRKKFKADLVSESRIKWLADFRKIFQKYLDCANEYKIVSELDQMYNPDDSSLKTEKGVHAAYNLESAYHSLKLLVMPVTENSNKIDDNDKRMWNHISVNYHNIIGQDVIEDMCLDENEVNSVKCDLDQLTKEARIYTKQIWKQASKGE